MTDKEFKKFYEWVNSINKDAFITDSYVEIGNIYYYKDGTIYSEGIIAKNRSQKQVKEIIKNLLEEK